MSNTKKKITVKIRWGEQETIREKYDLSNDSDCVEYSFETKAEKDAFLLGIDESDGWFGYDLYDDGWDVVPDDDE